MITALRGALAAGLCLMGFAWACDALMSGSLRGAVATLLVGQVGALLVMPSRFM